MNGTIGTLAEQVLHEVKQGSLVKLAEYRMVKEALDRPAAQHPFAKALLKLAEVLRRKNADVSIDDLQEFMANHAK